MIKPPRQTVRVIDSAAETQEIALVEGDGNAKVVLWPGNGGQFRSFQLLTLGRGSQTIVMNHASDCVYYVIEGSGSVIDLGSEQVSPLAEGSMIHIDSGDSYRLRADSGDPMRVLGGPCPPDQALYAHMKTAEG